jgi:hypothetical protein
MRVTVDSQKQVKVVALAGNGEVRNQRGMLVAHVRSGTALQIQAVGGNKAVLTGLLTQKDGKYILTDETSNVTVELRGSNLKKLVGKKVQVNGSVVADATPAAGASQVVTVASATALAAGAAAGTAAGAAGGAAAGGAATGAGAAAAGAGAAAGIATTTVVVGGAAVAAGGTVAGLAAAGTFTGDNSSVSR